MHSPFQILGLSALLFGLSVALNVEPACQCQLETTWLDIVFIFDSSKEVNRQDFYAVRNFAASFIRRIPVSQQLGQFSRVAIINGGDDAKVVANLTTFSDSMTAVGAIKALPYLGSTTFNLRSAMREAANIVGYGERLNVKRVVVIFSAKDEPCYYQNQRAKMAKEADTNPCRIASQMKENGHIIITVGLKYDGLHRFPEMRFGSDCFMTKFDENFSRSFLDAICRANCFCQPPFVQFTSTCQQYGVCLYQQSTPLPYTIAAETCADYGANIVDIFSAEKDNFVRNLMIQSGHQDYWIGAVYNNGTYTWPNGTPLAKDDYTNWAFGQPAITAGSCVFAGPTDINGTWRSANCDDFAIAHPFSCQMSACAANHYCQLPTIRSH